MDTEQQGRCEPAEADLLLAVLLCDRNKLEHCALSSWSRESSGGTRGAELYSLESEHGSQRNLKLCGLFQARGVDSRW